MIKKLSGMAFGVAVVAATVAATLTESPVADAAMRGDVEAVRDLIESGADVNAPQGDGMTALHWSARSGDPGLVALLVEAGAEPDPRTRIGGYTPLHLSAAAGHAEAMDALLEAGADARARTTMVGAAEPLHFAAASGSTDAVQLLLAHGAAVDVQEGSRGQTPLMFAAAKNRLDVVRMLLGAGADVALQTEVVDVARRAVTDREERRLRNERMKAPGDGYPVPARAEPGERAREAAAAADSIEEAQRQIEEPEPLTYGQLVGGHGGLTALLHAAREGHADVALTLVEGGAGIDQVSLGDGTSPMLIALLNGHFDLALEFLARGADPNLANAAGTSPLFAAINTHWAPKSRYPQQHAYTKQDADYLDVMTALIEAGADPNARLEKHVWHMSYNFDLLQVDTKGASVFWRAAYALDVEAMQLLIAAGADPMVPTEKVPERRFRRGGDDTDYSGLPPVPVGGPAVYPIHAATGVGYGQGFAANAHRHVPDGWLPALAYLVEELGADVNQRDHNGYTPLHHAASRGDTEMIQYLFDQGADPTAVSRRGQTTADMANGPYQRTQPYPEAVALLESLGSANSHNCVSC